MTTVTTSVTTVSGDEESGFLSGAERSIIRKTWDQAKKDGDVAPRILFK